MQALGQADTIEGQIGRGLGLIELAKTPSVALTGYPDYADPVLYHDLGSVRLG